jgi:hypothetical protein
MLQYLYFLFIINLNKKEATYGNLQQKIDHRPRTH